MIDKDHPFFFLERLFSIEKSIFHFSRYTYTPDSLFDDREHLSVTGADLTRGWVDAAIDSLEPDQELALHSKVAVDGRTQHIPMIDFSAAELCSEDLGRIRAYLPKSVFLSLGFYRSGRSFHAYSARLLGPKAWMQLMGRLLLINQRHRHEVVDTRWIGHRLIAGYCSLRFSSNTDQYLSMPRKVEIVTILKSKPPRLSASSFGVQ